MSQRRLIGGYWIINWKLCGRKWFSFQLRKYPRICLKWQGKTAEISWIFRCLSQFSNRVQIQFRRFTTSTDSLRMYKVVRHTAAWGTHLYLFNTTVLKSLVVNLKPLPVLALCSIFNTNNEHRPFRKLIVLVSLSTADRNRFTLAYNTWEWCCR